MTTKPTPPSFGRRSSTGRTTAYTMGVVTLVIAFAGWFVFQRLPVDRPRETNTVSAAKVKSDDATFSVNNVDHDNFDSADHGEASDQPLLDPIATVAVAWAHQDLATAVQRAKDLPSEDERYEALRSIAGEAVRVNPVHALELAVDLPADAARDDIIRRAAAEWASRDATGAVRWTRQILDQSLREQTLAHAIVAWAEADPQSAAVAALTELSPGRLQADTVVSIVQRWAQQRPTETAAWIDQFPAGELRRSAVENLAMQWAQQDAVAARRWREKSE